MNTRYPPSTQDIEGQIATTNGAPPAVPVVFLMRMAVSISRARWFSFLRRVFRYQNGSRSDLTSNPFNSKPWIVLEFAILVVQIVGIIAMMAISRSENPVWPLRIWVSGYNLGNLLSLPLIYWRYRNSNISRGNNQNSNYQEQLRNREESSSHLMNKSRTYLELFFAIWFVMGNVWVFDYRYDHFKRAPQLHLLCIALLAWNAICYSFPFLLFLLLCCCVPFISKVLGYNMNLASAGRGASDDLISILAHWKFKLDESRNVLANDNSECCICLANYKDGDEVRQLPCSHLFHLTCVDHWLRIISSCPMCKQELQK